MRPTDGAHLGDHIPAAVGALVDLLDLVVLDHLGAAHLCRAGIGMDRAGGVQVTLAVGPQPADHALDIHDRATFLDLGGRHQVTILDADGLEGAIGRLQPFPARRSRGDSDAASHVEPDILAGFLLDLGQKIDRIGLQRRHVRVGVQGMDTARRMPGRARRQHAALHQRHVGPAEFGQVIQHRGADHAAPDDHDTILGFHRRLR
jgi:hypothetical protein